LSEAHLNEDAYITEKLLPLQYMAMEDDPDFERGPYELGTVVHKGAHDEVLLSDEANAEFRKSLRGWYTQDNFGLDLDIEDDFDVRDPNDEGIWMETLEPKGIGEFYRSYEWQALHHATQTAICEADQSIKNYYHTGGDIGFPPSAKWTYVRAQIHSAVVDAWDTAVRLYKERAMNATAMAMISHRLTTGTRFKEEEMAALVEELPWISVASGAEVPVATLGDFIETFKEELEDLAEDGWNGDWSPRFPNEEQEVADVFAEAFENRMIAHWRAQAAMHKRVPVEDGVKIWSAVWNGERDVQWNIEMQRAIIEEGMTKEAAKAHVAHRMKERAKTQTWHANAYQVVGVESRGLKLADDSILSWSSAARSLGRLSVENKDSLVTRLRQIWVAAKDDPALANARPHIAQIGKFFA
jgi:hypothetical protein